MAVTEAEKQLWGDKLWNAKEVLAAKWSDALLAWKVYKLGRDEFSDAYVKAGLAPVALTEPGGWTDADQQKLLNMQEVVKRAVPGAEDALSGQRIVEIDPALGSLRVELLPTDPYALVIQGKDVVLVDPKAPTVPVNATGQIGAEHSKWEIVLGALSPLGLLVYECFFLSSEIIDYKKEQLKAQTQLDLQKKCADLVTANKYTPAECQALIKQIQDGQRALIEAETKKIEAESVSPTADVIKQGLWAVIIIGALGLGFYALQTFAPLRPARRAA